MDPVTILALFSAAVAAAKQAAALINDFRQQGLITEDQQKKVMEDLNSLRDGTAFEGPEWQPAP